MQLKINCATDKMDNDVSMKVYGFIDYGGCTLPIEEQ